MGRNQIDGSNSRIPTNPNPSQPMGIIMMDQFPSMKNNILDKLSVILLDPILNQTKDINFQSTNFLP